MTDRQPITTLTNNSKPISLTMSATEFSTLEEQLSANVDKLEKLNVANSAVNPLLYRETACCINNIKATLILLRTHLKYKVKLMEPMPSNKPTRSQFQWTLSTVNRVTT